MGMWMAATVTMARRCGAGRLRERSEQARRAVADQSRPGGAERRRSHRGSDLTRKLGGGDIGTVTRHTVTSAAAAAQPSTRWVGQTTRVRAGGRTAHGRRGAADLGQEFVKPAGGFTNSCAPQGLSATICETAVLRILARHAR